MARFILTLQQAAQVDKELAMADAECAAGRPGMVLGQIIKTVGPMGGECVRCVVRYIPAEKASKMIEIMRGEP
jgi:hypothetical protein